MTLAEFAQQRGFDLSHITPDGKIHRWGKNKNKWAIVFPDTGIAKFGDWSENREYVYKPKGKINLPPPDEIKRRTAERKANDAQKHHVAARRAKEILQAERQSADNYYLNQKGIKNPFGAVTVDDVLYVPMYIDGEIVGAQAIQPDGKKKFLAGQKFKGAYYIIGEITDKLYVCEGFSTGATIHMATGQGVACVFSCSNYEFALPGLKKLYPDATVVVCADDDKRTKGNPGLSSAKIAAAKYGYEVVFPKWQKVCGNLTDFNDLMMSDGIDEVKRQLMTTKVKDFQKARHTKNKAKKNEKAIMCRQMVRLLMHDKRSPFDPIKEVFWVTEPEPGKPQILVEGKDEVVSYVSDGAVVSALAKYCENNLAGTEYEKLTTRDFDEVVRYWKHLAQPIPEPATVLEETKPGKCFRRLPFDIDRFNEDKPPLFSEFLSRCTNGEALAAWIGSLFYPQADRAQYVWLYGTGMNGKSSLLKLLAMIFGPAAINTLPPSNDNRFWIAQLLGKRLVIFSDCDNHKFPSTGLFKMITGDEMVPVEYKGKQSFQSLLNCKIIFASNDKPDISGQIADLRRAIYCRVDPINSTPKSDYVQSLWSEAAHLLWYCEKAYTHAGGVNKHNAIPVDNSELDLVVEENQCELETIFDSNFTIEPDRKKPLNQQLYFTSTQLGRFIKLTAQNRYFIKRHDFIKYMETKYGIINKVVKVDGGTQRRFVGASLDYFKNTE